MKLIIAAIRDKKPPGREAALDVPLEKRVHYAIDCIEANAPQADQAREFLRNVADRIDNPELLQRIHTILSGEAS